MHAGGWISLSLFDSLPLLVASVLPFASSSYRHRGAFGESVAVVTHRQEMDAQAKNKTKPSFKQASR